jgi:hypothetical protein
MAGGTDTAEPSRRSEEQSQSSDSRQLGWWAGVAKGHESREQRRYIIIMNSSRLVLVIAPWRESLPVVALFWSGGDVDSAVISSRACRRWSIEVALARRLASRSAGLHDDDDDDCSLLGGG